MGRIPGPICWISRPVFLDPGTLILQPTSVPGPQLAEAAWDDTEPGEDATAGIAPPVPSVPGPGAPPWMEIAEGELSVREIPGRRHNPRVIEYLNLVGLGGGGDETAWCSAFANWCMHEAGLEGSGKANARSWLTWGSEAQETYGAVTVLWRERRDSWKGHVAFFVGSEGDHILLLGGNQGQIGSVSVKAYPRSQLLGFRWPPRFPSDRSR